MAGLNTTRLIMSVLIGCALAVAGGLHAASMVTAKRSPALALSLFAPNAEARERAAYAAFTAQVTDPADLRSAALPVREEALAAYRSDPSSARALGLLALAIPDAAKRNDAVLSAARLNRRELTLQGLALEAHLARKDTSKVIETLDQILRVRPSYNAQFFPLIADAFADPANVDDFVRLLDGSSPWHDRFFLTYALHEERLLPNLALVREERVIGGLDFDRQLIAKLGRTGEIETAQRLMTKISRKNDDRVDGKLGWSSTYPPFDWSFRDRGDFRAQASRDGSVMEIFVRPGQGGIIAERILPMPDAPFTISFSQEAENAAQAGKTSVELRCAGTRPVFFQQALTNGANRLSVTSTPDCDQMALAFNSRTFRGEPTLSSEIGQISIR